jgi:hypothetical protein
VDLTARGVLIGLASIIAVCGVALLWVDRKSLRLCALSNGIWFWRHGDGSLEAMLITVIVYSSQRWRFAGRLNNRARRLPCTGRRSDRKTGGFYREKVMGDDPLEKQVTDQMGHKPYAHVPSLGKISIWLLSIVVVCGLLLYLAVSMKLIQ